MLEESTQKDQTSIFIRGRENPKPDIRTDGQTVAPH